METRHLENYARLLEANAKNRTVQKLGRPILPDEIETIGESFLHDYHGPRPPAAEAKDRAEALETIEKYT